MQGLINGNIIGVRSEKSGNKYILDNVVNTFVLYYEHNHRINIPSKEWESTTGINAQSCRNIHSDMYVIVLLIIFVTLQTIYFNKKLDSDTNQQSVLVLI